MSKTKLGLQLLKLSFKRPIACAVGVIVYAYFVLTKKTVTEIVDSKNNKPVQVKIRILDSETLH